MIQIIQIKWNIGLKQVRFMYIAVLWLYLTFTVPFHSGLLVSLSTTLPIGGGLGSSASFCVALVTAFFSRYGVISSNCELSSKNYELINTHAYQMECLVHGKPSGIDNSISTYGMLWWPLFVIIYKVALPCFKSKREHFSSQKKCFFVSLQNLFSFLKYPDFKGLESKVWRRKCLSVKQDQSISQSVNQSEFIHINKYIQPVIVEN